MYPITLASSTPDDIDKNLAELTQNKEQAQEVQAEEPTLEKSEQPEQHVPEQLKKISVLANLKEKQKQVNSKESEPETKLHSREAER